MLSLVDGTFTPLLGCDACLDLEVLKFMNLQLIDSPDVPQKIQFYMDTKTVSVTNPKNFQTKYIWKLILQSHQLYTLPGKFQLLRWNLQEKNSEMEEAGIIVKEDEPTAWVSSMLVIDKRKVNDKRKDTPPSKDDV